MLTISPALCIQNYRTLNLKMQIEVVIDIEGSLSSISCCFWRLPREHTRQISKEYLRNIVKDVEEC